MRIIDKLNPNILVLSSLTYILGAGIARYLGINISFVGLIFGWFVITTSFLAFFILDYFYLKRKYSPEIINSTSSKNHNLLLQVASGLFVFCSFFIIGMLILGLLTWSAGILLVITILLLCFYAIPPIWLSDTGFGGIILSFIIGFNIPLFSFLLHGNEYHPILLLVTIPLTILGVAFHIAMDFSTYGNNTFRDHRSFLDRIPWQKGITIHHCLTLSAFLLYLIMPLFGVSWKLIWPIFLSFPFSFLVIIWLQQIGRGDKPNWKYFKLILPMVLGLHIYLLLISFWTR